jgi:low affinity Fe/Cu permease
MSSTPQTDEKHQGLFTQFAQRVAVLSGRPIVFLMAISIVLAWAITGPLFNYSDTWQLVINTGTTIISWYFSFSIPKPEIRWLSK